MVGEKGYKISRVYPLAEWDISFAINVDVLSRFLAYLAEINPDVPILFLKDKIVIRQRSSDNVSFTRIEIEVSDDMMYNPGLGDNPKDTDNKFVLIDGEELAEEIAGYSKGGDLVIVKIDTKKMKKVEFACGEFKTWVPLLIIPDFLYKLESVEKRIRENRDNPNLKGCSMIIEPDTYTKICALGGKKKGSDIIFEASKKGLLVYTSDEESGRSFEILNESDHVGMSPDDMSAIYGKEVDKMANEITENEDDYDEANDSDSDASEIGNIEKDIGVSSDTSGSDINSNADSNENNSGSSDDPLDAWGMSMPGSDVDTSVKNSKKKGKKKKEDEFAEKEEKEDKRSSEVHTNVKAGRSKFLSFDMAGNRNTVSVQEKKEYICVFSKLKAQNPISIELRHNAPLILEQSNSGMWKVLLTIAPIIDDNS